MEACETIDRTLPALLAGLVSPEVRAGLDGGEVPSLHVDSRTVTPGGLFIAVRGVRHDGRGFIADALSRGAAWIVGEGLPPLDRGVGIEVADVRAAVARLAVRWYGVDRLLADGRLRLVGITGTNGKTTTAYLLRAILRQAGRRCALLGTVEYDLCGTRLVSSLTTPGPLDLARHLRTAFDNGATEAVLEVSSHALSQKRVDGLRFAGVAWTNLTQDHLDYHADLEQYAAAKARLLDLLTEDGVALLNRDDARVAAAGEAASTPVRWYGLSAGEGLLASGLRGGLAGTTLRLRCADGGSLPLTVALPGAHNVSNALAAAGLAEVLGIAPEQIAAGLAACTAVPGRVQRVASIERFSVFVDYAHTPDALEHVGAVLRGLTRKRVIVVFGCGGERDRGKRPLMGQAALRNGHVAILTSDNPRGEDPQAIIADVLGGLTEAERVRMLVEPDRRAAIRVALGAAQPGDVVLVAGKGHEDYQLIDGGRQHFDDVQVIRELAVELGLAAEDGQT